MQTLSLQVHRPGNQGSARHCSRCNSAQGVGLQRTATLLTSHCRADTHLNSRGIGLPQGDSAIVNLLNCAKQHASSQVPDSAVLLAEESEVANDVESLGLTRADGDSVYESVPLILNLMVEKIKGNSSKWAGYLNFLPESLPGLPFQWDVRSNQNASVLPSVLPSVPPSSHT